IGLLTPAAAPPEEPPEKAELMTTHPIREGLQRKKPLILLAEDDPTNRQVFAAMLQRCGYSVIEAENGRKVLEIYRKHPFDLVLMDVRMPHMNGIEATSAIRGREQENSPGSPEVRIPIIAMTGQAGEEDRENSLKAGMDDHISKPFRRKQLLEVVDRVLQNQDKKVASGTAANKPDGKKQKKTDFKVLV
ncbi:MAG: response regulator, partial [bacterium]|nr:response regulator [bacterium]